MRWTRRWGAPRAGLPHPCLSHLPSLPPPCPRCRGLLQIHRNEDVSIKVTQSPGFLCHIEASAAFRMPAHTLYRQVITTSTTLQRSSTRLVPLMRRPSYMKKGFGVRGRGKKRVRGRGKKE